jgi:serine protease Do
MLKHFIIFISTVCLLYSCNLDFTNKTSSDKHKIDSLENKLKYDSLKNENLNLINSQTNIEGNLSELYEKLSNSVFLVVAGREEGVAIGSAFLIDNKGTCVTNFHVIINANEVILLDKNHKQHIARTTTNYDKVLDYMVLKIDDATNISPLSIAAENPKIGEKCFAIGNPKGLESTLSDGIISNYQDNETYIQITAPITHGSSGGPLFNSKGEVIGITTMGLEGTGNLNFALNINKIGEHKSVAIRKEENFETRVSMPNVIQTFMDGEEEKDFDKINSSFSSNLKMYWDLKYPTREVLYNRFNHLWDITRDAKNTIKSIRKVNDYVYDVTVDYSVYSLKKQTEINVYNSVIRYELDSQGLIESVNQISKGN